MTNGKMLQLIFPKGELHDGGTIYLFKIDTTFHEFNKDWWDAEYKEPTTKNDCAEQNGCITCSLDDDDCCRKLYEESMKEPTTKNDLAVDKSDEFEEWKLNEDKDCYLRIGDIVDRFKEIDEHYNHSPWNLTQIFSNLNILQRVEYKVEDCIPREQAKSAIRDKFKDLPSRVEINTILNELPSVTPIRPKGHWKLVQRGKLIDVCCSNCGAVRIKGYAYNYTIDELNNNEDINECFRSAEMSFCPNCGSDNREVEG